MTTIRRLTGAGAAGAVVGAGVGVWAAGVERNPRLRPSIITVVTSYSVAMALLGAGLAVRHC